MSLQGLLEAPRAAENKFTVEAQSRAIGLWKSKDVERTAPAGVEVPVGVGSVAVGPCVPGAGLPPHSALKRPRVDE